MKMTEKTRNYYNNLIVLIGACMSVFQLYTGIFGSMEAFYQRTLHLFFAMVLVFMIYDYKGKAGNRFKLWDSVYILLTVVTMGYLLVQHDYLVSGRFYYIDELTGLQIVLGVVAIIVLLEATRRVVGPQLPIVAVAFILYSFVGDYMPGFLNHQGSTLGLFLDVQYLTTAGIFSTPIAISATYLFLFILLGAVLAETGFGVFLLDFSTALAGRTRGGPAKVAVVSSGLVGSISGSAVANVVTTGTFTIPLMKRVGYKPHFAAAVESAASSGGQIMPPVMGVAAFLMAEFTGIPYIEIVKFGLLPGILYFLAVLFMVDFEAAKMGLKGLPKEELPNLLKTLRRTYLALPLVLLIALLILGYSPNFAGSFAIVLAFVIGFFDKENRFNAGKVVNALASGAKQSLVVVLSCATAGIIVGVVGLTGLGANFTRIVVDLAGGSLALALFFTMITGIVLGMGLPTGAMYVIQVALIIPALIEMGLPVYSAHMFVVYFAAISMITPPVCLASFAAAGIAGCDAMKAGWTGMRLGAAAYIVPFIFAYEPALLLVGSFDRVLLAAVTAIVGIYLLSAGLQGYFLKRINLLQRVIAIAASLVLIKPGLYTDLLGFALLALLVIWQLIEKRASGGKSSAPLN